MGQMAVGYGHSYLYSPARSIVMSGGQTGGKKEAPDKESSNGSTGRLNEHFREGALYVSEAKHGAS